MKKLFLLMLILASATVPCTKKGDKQKTKYRIEASANNIQNLTFQCRDDASATQLSNYNQSTWSKEWIGYNSNEISITISHTDQSGHIKLYLDDELVEEVFTQGITEATTLKFKN